MKTLHGAEELQVAWAVLQAQGAISMRTINKTLSILISPRRFPEYTTTARVESLGSSYHFRSEILPGLELTTVSSSPCIDGVEVTNRHICQKCGGECK